MHSTFLCPSWASVRCTCRAQTPAEEVHREGQLHIECVFRPMGHLSGGDHIMGEYQYSGFLGWFSSVESGDSVAHSGHMPTGNRGVGRTAVLGPQLRTASEQALDLYLT